MIDHLRAHDDPFVFLRVVADRDARTEHHIAGVVRLEAGENAQERRFAGAVEAKYEQALAPPQSERKVRPDTAATERLREAVDLQDVATAVRRRREAVAHAAGSADRRDRFGGEPFHTLVEGLRLSGALRARVAHPVGEGGEPADLGVLTRGDASKPVLILRPGG